MAQVDQLSVRQVYATVRGALRFGLDVDVVRDFLAAVDWGPAGAAAPGIVRTLGDLEGWTTAYDEGELSEAQYVARLLSLLPARERRDRLVMGGGAIIDFRLPGPAAEVAVQPPAVFDTRPARVPA